MKLEGLTVSVGYADFLEHTLPDNLQHFDRFVVVTHPNDKATQSLCTKFGVDCIKTEVMHDDGDKFNKGRLCNLGLSHLRHDGWLVHLDADIVLPHRFRPMLAHAKLDTANIYGADRLNCRSYDDWLKYRNKLVPQHMWRFLVTPVAEFSLGSRLLHQEYGWCPIGYFQMWHASQQRSYPINHGSAEHSDVLFAVQWPRPKRILLPEFFVTHLESGASEFGANWQGRKTKPFGPAATFAEPPKNHQTDKREYSK